MNSGTLARLSRLEAEMFDERRRCALLELEACDGAVQGLPACGAKQGDRSGLASFALPFIPSILYG